MNPILATVILALIQGWTEFLPISSSGHLVLAQHLLGVESAGVALEIILHLGTVFAVILYYREDFLSILSGGWDFVRGGRGPEAVSASRLILFLVLGTIPGALGGALFKDTIESAFGDVRFVCYALLFTGALLLSTLLVPRKRERLSPLRAFLVGAFQLLALLPGVSRSGSTISGGLFLGIDPEEAARFSFLLSVPIILGAVAFQLPDVGAELRAGHLPQYLIGLVVAFVSGYVAIGAMLKIVRRGRFGFFGIYCLLVGILGLFIL
ncbi:MAG: undecaprenyl-diphosphate phosphatase [Candidatus Eisenbacteria bacterium]|uniref:Undecaprenyl-diphosphatase n=1 Tax=Eiseniibacteriota bacterium TaxID=2212470 RepID=A0A956SDV2_UNCEI|nr:undecaprenyl-diphosphate phosphatase [Candidatus Eisenbacteria bacterium]MCB9466328.1 undecaprenyl-diphosphate phosphatase [Candidatus Eisenbacteria bacterium]